MIPSTMGEPLIYKHFSHFIELCYKYNLKMNLTTNGTFPKTTEKSFTEWAKLIVPITTDIKISWNGATAETSQKVMLKINFEEAVENVKEKILIESPWIKRATQEYIPLFEKLLKDKKQLIILYGISEKDEHNIYTLKKVEELQKQHKDKFKLIHLPTHFAEIHSKLTGTHRKLVIKDNEYYIQGSFNFLSFGKNDRNPFRWNKNSLFIKWNL